jgi:hypothetical protein
MSDEWTWAVTSAAGHFGRRTVQLLVEEKQGRLLAQRQALVSAAGCAGGQS